MKSIATKIDCAECGRSFTPKTRTHILCSNKCRNLRDRQRMVPASTGDYALLGEAAELIVAADLMRRGLIVFQNIARSGPADLVAWVPDRHEVVFIDVKGITSAYLAADGSLRNPYQSRLQDQKRRTWIVVVMGTDIHYPPHLAALLQFEP